MKLIEQLGQTHITQSVECRASMLQEGLLQIPQQRDGEAEDLLYTALETPSGTRIMRGVAKIAGAEVRYTYEEPLNVTDPVPMLLAPGYCGIKSQYRLLRHNIAEQGKPAISYRPARSQEFPASLHPQHLRDVTKLSSQVAYAVMRDVRNVHKKDVFDIAGHSFGGKTTADVANHKPEHVRSVLFVASVGLHGVRSLKEMRRRGRDCITNEVIPNLNNLASSGEARMALDALHYIIRNPLRTLREGVVAGTCDITKDVANLRHLGIKTGALQFAADAFFYPEEVEKHSGHLFDILRHYDDPKAMHIAPQLTPEPVAKTLVDMVHELHPANKAA